MTDPFVCDPHAHKHSSYSGLGSSSAAIVGGLIAGLVLAGHQLPCWGSEELLQLAASIEGACVRACVL